MVNNGAVWIFDCLVKIDCDEVLPMKTLCSIDYQSNLSAFHASRSFAPRFFIEKGIWIGMHALVKYAVVGDDVGGVVRHEQTLDAGMMCFARSRPLISGMTT